MTAMTISNLTAGYLISDRCEVRQVNLSFSNHLSSTKIHDLLMHPVARCDTRMRSSFIVSVSAHARRGSRTPD